MDDPISALDANVKKKIFKNVFMKKFKTKTRVLVTHAVDFLHLVDTIVLLKKGRVVLKGSYHDLKESEYLKEVIGIHKSHQNLNSGELLRDTSYSLNGFPSGNKGPAADSGSSPIDDMIETLDDVESMSESSCNSQSEDERKEGEEDSQRRSTSNNNAINEEIIQTIRLKKVEKKTSKRSHSIDLSSTSEDTQ